jgi:hypothetical protein
MMGNVLADVALMLLVEKSASSEAELEQNLDIYDSCSKKTGNLIIKIYFLLHYMQ